jgi:DNA-binding LacI/PurR family transcriptional regulator
MTSKNGKTPSDKTAARPDLRRLAGHLGVSQTTVSCVLNGAAKNYRISEETQQRVLAAASTLLQMINNERQAWPKHPIRVLLTFVERQSTATATIWQDREDAPSPVPSVSAFAQR